MTHHNRKLLLLSDQRLREMYEKEGYALRELGNLCGVSATTIKRRLLTQGSDLRQRGRPRDV